MNNKTPKGDIFFKIIWKNYYESEDLQETWGNVRLVEKMHDYLNKIKLKNMIPMDLDGSRNKQDINQENNQIITKIGRTIKLPAKLNKGLL